jgi:hypothetical protein
MWSEELLELFNSANIGFGIDGYGSSFLRVVGCVKIEVETSSDVVDIQTEYDTGGVFWITWIRWWRIWMRIMERTLLFRRCIRSTNTRY